MDHFIYFFFLRVSLRLRVCVQCNLRNDASNSGVILGSACPLKWDQKRREQEAVRLGDGGLSGQGGFLPLVR